MAVLRKLIKRIFTRALPLLSGLTIATTSQAFDAGTSDPNLREFDRLVNGTGGDNCRIEVGYLQASQNLTQLLVVTDRGGAYNQYHYNGGYYRSSNNTWSSSESAYYRSTTGVADDLTTMSASTLATDCGWTSATITDLTPSSGFGASGTSFDAADTASIRLDYVYNGRSFSATATISGGASDVPTVSSNYTGTPGAPTSLVATPQNGSASISFTAPSDLPSDPNESDNAIVNYEYSLDSGSTWVALSPAVASSPVVISGLTNGTTYSVTLRGVNGVGTGIASSAVSVVPADTTAPIILSSSPSDDATGVAVGSNIVLTFNENIAAGTGNIVISDGLSDTRTIPVGDAKVTLAGATLTINPSADLAYSTAYNVQIASTAIDDSAGNSYAGIANATTLNFTTAAAPSNIAPVADAGSDQTVASAAAVTLDGSGSSDADSGDTLTYAWTQTSGATVTLSSATAQQPTFTAPSLNVGDADAVLVFSLVVNDGIVNSSADTVTITVEAPASTPASEFAAHEAEIRNTLVGDASRSLRSSVAANRRLAQSARERFIEFSQAQAREEDVTRALIPFDIGGNFTLSESGLNTSGNFFQQVGNEEGTYRRLFFGDFDVQHDNDTDSTTATLTGRMAWEHMTSEQTMLGYFIGGELATSNIGGSFEGDQDRIGVTAGGYVVHELSEQVYFDGSASVGAGRNDLEMANDTLALESEYTTQTATLGGAITGVYSQKGYDFQPELALSFGKTWLGNVGFTGRAYGLTDDALSLDAGTVSIANLTFRPEVIIPISADFVADTNMQFTYAPRLICEQIKSTTKTSDCGTGGELGFSSTSEDALSSADMRILLDRINSGTRSSFVFSVEHKF